MLVATNRIISIRYTMRNGKGELLESTLASDPVNYLHGSSSIESGLQVQLEGLKQGDRKKVYLLASSGHTSDNFEFDVIIDSVNSATEEEIILGYPVNRSVTRCEPDCDCYPESN